MGNYSPTILVQSIGGGGGWTGAVEGRANLGSINASQIAQQNSSDIDIISNGPSLRTNGSNSAGIALQSTAGGGGWVGSVGENLTLGAKNSEAAMNSGNINVLNTGNIWTFGKTSPGMSVQSIGGGGGYAGNVDGSGQFGSEIAPEAKRAET